MIELLLELAVLLVPLVLLVTAMKKASRLRIDSHGAFSMKISPRGSRPKVEIPHFSGMRITADSSERKPTWVSDRDEMAILFSREIQGAPDQDQRIKEWASKQFVSKNDYETNIAAQLRVMMALTQGRNASAFLQGHRPLTESKWGRAQDV